MNNDNIKKGDLPPKEYCRLSPMKALPGIRKLWQTIKTRFQATWFWRIFGVCAMQCQWTKFLVAVAIMAGYWGLYLGIELLNPILPLQQLKRTEGVLVRLYQPLKSAHGSTITIRTDEGSMIKFRGTMFDNEKKALIQKRGQKVTVWHQDYFELWPPFYYNKFWEVSDVTGNIHISYEEFWYGINTLKPSDIRWCKRMLILTAACLTTVIIACVRDAAKVHNQE